jgi:serine/threonine protein kinase
MNDFEKQKLQRRAKEIEQGIQIPNKLKENYICGPILGSGHFSIVRQVTEISTGEEYAMKIINKLQTFDPHSGIKIHQEIEILKKVKHQYIISLKEVFESETHIFLIMELVRGGELFDMLVERGSFLEKDAVIIIQHLMEGVQYLHNSGIVHRDLKPENILICNCVSKKNKSLYCCTQPWMIKIADFGLARILGEKNNYEYSLWNTILCCTRSIVM